MDRGMDGKEQQPRRNGDRNKVHHWLPNQRCRREGQVQLPGQPCEKFARLCEGQLEEVTNRLHRSALCTLVVRQSMTTF